jgi:hypothetical protein
MENKIVKLKPSFLVMVALLCIATYGYFAVKINGPAFGISIDLSKPISIVWPCEISVVGDNGEKGLRIAPKVGRGWRGEAGGQASYKFFIPENGKYHIWAYCLWYDECANAIFAQINDLDKAIVGNDPIYKKWHWVRGFDIKLKKGTHSLVLSNHSDHIALQKIIFTGATSLRPQEAGIVFSDIFYDGFDGCDQGNFPRWRQIYGTWHAVNPDSQTCLIENALIGESEDEAFIVYENDNWDNYCLDLSVKLLPSDSEDCSVGICFGIEDPNNLYMLKIKPIQTDNKAKMTILRKQLHKSINLSEFKLPFRLNRWQQVQIGLDTKWIEVRISESNPVKTGIDEKITGGVGFLLEGKITAYFDNIHVRQIIRRKIKR